MGSGTALSEENRSEDEGAREKSSVLTWICRRSKLRVFQGVRLAFYRKVFCSGLV